MDNNTNFDKLYNFFYNTTQLPETNDPIDGYSEIDDLNRIARKRALRQMDINQRRKQTIQQARNSKHSMQNASGLSGQVLKKFIEDPEIRQAMYEKFKLADRNEGGMQYKDNTSFFGDGGYKPLDIDVANFALWKKEMEKPGNSNFFGTAKPAPKSVATTRMFKKAKAKPNHSWLFGVEDR